MEGRARTMVAILILCSILLPLALAKSGHKGLHVGFYKNSCPRAEEIVAEVVSEAYKKDPGIAAGLLRILSHDCFVTGCDASLLLDSNRSGGKIEKESPANGKFLRGFEVIDTAKERLERECPETVSCADTLSFATRDGSVLSGVPHYHMPGGRRDSLVSRAEDVRGNIPLFNSAIQQITEIFVRKGLTQEEMVVLTGAHSIGVAHCPTFAYRVHQYNESFQTDPNLDPVDSANIKAACPEQMSIEDMEKATLPFDTNTPFKMDGAFYKKLLLGQALIESDQAMAMDPRTRIIVERLAQNNDKWLNKFGRAMRRLAAVEVKTGSKGEIRKHCRMVNSENKENGGDAKDSGKSGNDQYYRKSTDVEDSGKFRDAEHSGKSSDVQDSKNFGDAENSSSHAESGDAEDSNSYDFSHTSDPSNSFSAFIHHLPRNSIGSNL